MSIRTLLVEGQSSIGTRLRAQRQGAMAEAFPSLSELRVLDLGGTAEYWQRSGAMPASVTLLNSASSEMPQREHPEPVDGVATDTDIDMVVGDACDPPAEIREREFDLVFSNSVIEHVGGPYRRAQFAEFVLSAAPGYWIQTPYRYFPVEPHWLFPGFQFLPLNVRAALSRTWPLMHTRSTTKEGSITTALDVELIGTTELRYLFPDAELYKERVLGLTKSIVAFRRGPMR